MGIVSREQIKAWFKKGMYPLEAWFWSWADSYWHKEDDTIPMTSIDGLAAELNNKYPNTSGQALESSIGGFQSALSEHEAANMRDFSNIREDIQDIEDMIGADNGIAQLDANGKVPVSQINDALLGNVSYQGIWDPINNIPVLTDTPEDKGHYYIASADGTRFGLTFSTGDWIISHGDEWQKVDNTDAVASVNGKIGVVTLSKSDIGLDNVDNTSDANKPISMPIAAALASKQGLLTAGDNITIVDDVISASGSGGSGGTAGGDLSGTYPNPKVRQGETFYPTAYGYVTIKTNIPEGTGARFFGRIQATMLVYTPLDTIFTFSTNGEIISDLISVNEAANVDSLCAFYSGGYLCVGIYSARSYNGFIANIFNLSAANTSKAASTNVVSSFSQGLPADVIGKVDANYINSIRTDTVAGGDLEGKYPNPTIKAGAISKDKTDATVGRLTTYATTYTLFGASANACVKYKGTTNPTINLAQASIGLGISLENGDSAIIKMAGNLTPSFTGGTVRTQKGYNDVVGSSSEVKTYTIFFDGDEYLVNVLVYE